MIPTVPAMFTLCVCVCVSGPPPHILPLPHCDDHLLTLRALDSHPSNDSIPTPYTLCTQHHLLARRSLFFCFLLQLQLNPVGVCSSTGQLSTTALHCSWSNHSPKSATLGAAHLQPWRTVLLSLAISGYAFICTATIEFLDTFSIPKWHLSEFFSLPLSFSLAPPLLGFCGIHSWLACSSQLDSVNG